ncbi:sensor histidine kinase [Anabaena minutissima FACHB-250]|nr:sensor histidine kinase [Anabaena minutissima FACHB-250]
MNRLLQVKTHPFRLLLYLEWILLVITILGELPWESIPYLGTLLAESSQTSKLLPYSWLLNIICIIGFGFMGLRLPRGTTASKWLYTALELGIIWLVTAWGSWRISFLSPYLIVVIRSCLIFQPTGRLLSTGLVFLSFLLSLVISVKDLPAIQLELTQPRPVTLNQIRIWFIISNINTTILFGLVLVFVLMLVNALLAERQSRQKLTLAHNQLHQYALRIEDQATLQERNRIAREIHDSLGHALTAQSIQLENALLFCHSNPDKTQVFVSEAKQLASIALKEIRQSISTLRSDPLQEKNLESALTSLIEDFGNRTNITLDSTIDLTQSVTIEVKTAIYRIIQEALTNISKHSHAKQVTLKLQTTPEYLHLLIEDNGRGFNPEQNTTGFGLQGMRERTLALEGNFRLASEMGKGCCVTVNIPLRKFLP